jgi:alkanesulfonate monooxygenase SsuD/methylene tetrahydromethanopterin reductase-like flavin-dependent oxidoreductase (luciferase family)
MLRLSGRVRVELEGEATDHLYAMRGSPEDVAAEIRTFADVGVDHLALLFPERDPEGIVRAMERFMAEVAPLA